MANELRPEAIQAHTGAVFIKGARAREVSEAWRLWRKSHDDEILYEAGIWQRPNDDSVVTP